MYKALDIAIYTINHVNKSNSKITNLKLQKILYYIQAAFLCEKKKPCFSDPILCWRHGPVIRSVYDAFNKYGDKDIPTQSYVTRIISENGKLKLTKVEFNENIISYQDRKLINKVVEALMVYSPWYLVDRTHEEAPWSDLKQYNEEITIESIANYFANNRERIYGQFKLNN